MYIVVGDKEIARKIARIYSNCVFVGKDTDDLKDINVIEGDPLEIIPKLDLSSAKVVLASDESTNSKIAEFLKSKGVDVVEVNVERVCDLYRKLRIDRASNGTGVRRKYLETVVGKSLSGVPLRRMDMGDECAVVSVFRGGKLLRPHPELILKEGDTLGILCGEEIRQARNPFDNILRILRGYRDEDIITESRMLSERFESNIITLKLVSGNAGIVKDLTKLDEADLVVTSAIKKKDNLIEELSKVHPTVVARGKREYKKILAVVNSSDPFKIISLSKVFARAFDYVKLLLLEKEQLVYASKVIETSVDVSVTEGNPFVEFVREFKRRYDLLIISLKNDVGNIDEDIIWKVIVDMDTSVLLV
ncbi:TrkA C-terminal domain-containing protein [Archaeoglobus profundus]|uniref:TrkA-C domain protein n=1 Tax=Archaeoglobus profundus (strain DSM 5631 / JCM 9629 / NBRC 100127 / Av18) TaxID=572546 RepID=D2RGS2_ARCPA|nr:TrkA C-terminal domain-containing protein [Archaeoglobus profundus]ADB57497.1 TrkA-C domain protein [Archaeoglobus profundus DSM 5631]